MFTLANESAFSVSKELTLAYIARMSVSDNSNLGIRSDEDAKAIVKAFDIIYKGVSATIRELTTNPHF